MNYSAILDAAKTKLKENSDFIQQLESCIASGSTGGEIASIVGAFLKKYKDNNDPIYYSLKKEIDNYLHDCRTNGLYII